MFGKKKKVKSDINTTKEEKEIFEEKGLSHEANYWSRHDFEVSIPLQIISTETAKNAKFLLPFARALLSDKKRGEIEKSHLPGEPDYIIVGFILSSFAWAILFSLLIFLLQILSYATPESAAPLSLLTFVFSFLFFFYIHYIYPSILANKIAEATDAELSYVLREMWIDATAGVPLYNMLVNIAKGGYGAISRDIDSAVRDISVGERDVIALEKVAQKTKSENFKRILWHLSSAMRTGVGLIIALENSINMMSSEQIRKIREYGASLNFYLLLYLLFAAVIPTIVLTFFAILSAFGVFPISFDVLFGLVVLSALCQVALIGLMRTGRPNIV